MESLAALVGGLFLAEIALGIATVFLATLSRRQNRFKRFSTILLVILAIQTIWALSLSPAFGFPPLLCLAIASLIRFLPIRPR
jgi:hypothetical protein